MYHSDGSLPTSQIHHPTTSCLRLQSTTPAPSRPSDSGSRVKVTHNGLELLHQAGEALVQSRERIVGQHVGAQCGQVIDSQDSNPTASSTPTPDECRVRARLWNSPGARSIQVSDAVTMDDVWPPSPTPPSPPLMPPTFSLLPIPYYRLPAPKIAPRPMTLLERVLHSYESLGPASQIPLSYLRGESNFPPVEARSPSVYSPRLSNPRLFGPTLDQVIATSSSSTSRARAIDRIATLSHRAKIWKALAGEEVPSGLSETNDLRNLVLIWMSTYDPAWSTTPSSPQAVYMASVLFSLYWADRPSSSLPLTGLQTEAVLVAISCLTLAIKWENDSSAPKYALTLHYFSGHSPSGTRLTCSQIIDCERRILRSPSIWYGFPTTPYDYLYELPLAIPFLGGLKERAQLWTRLSLEFDGHLSAATTCQEFLSVHPSLLASAALILSIRALGSQVSLSDISTCSNSSFDDDDSMGKSRTPSLSPPTSIPDPFFSALEFYDSSSCIDDCDDRSDVYEMDQDEWEADVFVMEKIVVMGLKEVLGVDRREMYRWVQWIEGLAEVRDEGSSWDN